MLAFPNAKINIGLNILSKRPDGYHNISSCFYPIPWHDILEIIPAEKFSIKITGTEIPGNTNDNLCVKAYKLLVKYHQVKPVSIHLHKEIPTGAGLGGGSSDGAFCLKLIDAIYGLNLGINLLQEYALELGSDCPFFIENMPVIATGRGEQFDYIDLDLSSYYIGIIHPKIHVNTAGAYANISPKNLANSLKSDLSKSPDKWANSIKNDFYQEGNPLIDDAISVLNDAGALFTSLSGSGSAVYGVFASDLKNISAFDLFKPMRLSS